MMTIRTEQQQNIDNVKMKQTTDMKRNLEQVTEPGASGWLGALPLSQYGMDLEMGEFQDALCLRYNMPLVENLTPTMP